MTQTTAKKIRIFTTAPIMAAVLISALYISEQSTYKNLNHFLAALFFLTALPLLSYVFSYFIPPLKRKGRKAERTLAVIFSVIGYIGGTVYCILNGGAKTEFVIYSTYLLSGVAVAIFSAIGIKASGHACGVSGPAAMLTYTLGFPFALTFLVLVPVYVSSLKLKRHKITELLLGTVIPIIALIISVVTAQR